MNWRLGIDLGTNSLGWAALELNNNGQPDKIIDAGARIFSDGRNPKDKQSNAVKRREPRSARRNRDRGKNRQARLMAELVKYGLMPEDLTKRKMLEGGKGISQLETDPWILRARALDEEISLHQLGRIIFHLSQRRGFKSNRKTDRADNDKGKVKEAIKKTQQRLNEKNARTLGEFFGGKRLDVARENAETPKGMRQPQPLARVRKSGEGAKWQYDYYPTRELTVDEFEQIWDAQSQYHKEALNEEAYKRIKETLEFQRPLRAQPIGKCTFYPEEKRAPKALPSFQRNRIYQEINNLTISSTGKAEKTLTPEQRNKLAEYLLRPTNKKGNRTFDQIKKHLGFSRHDFFNLESEKRKTLDGDETAAVMKEKKYWGETWFDLDLKEQNEIINRLINEENEKKLITWLKDTYDFSEEQAENIADASLPDGHGNLSEKAIDELLPELSRPDKVIHYDEAARKVFDDHSNFATGELLYSLPYYGKILERSVAFGTGEQDDIDEKRYGKIANPTVHVALKQVEVVVNDLLKRFGTPEEIVVEIARDLPLSAKGKSELNSNQKKNQEANEKRREWLNKEGIDDNYLNRQRLRLYDEMDPCHKCCIYSGTQIARSELFSGGIEVDHILPNSRTFDDGISNLVLCTTRANRDKGNRSPHEAFSHNPYPYNWEEISKRVVSLPENKKWRFGPEAMEKFDDEEKFADRQLNNTRYIAKKTKEYLEAIYGGAPKTGGKQHVWVVTGKLTSDLRYLWGLDSVLRGHNELISEAQKKNRNDHRHHAIDAIVIGLTDRSLVKRASDIAKQNDDRSQRIFKDLKEPWQGFRDDVRSAIDAITISHKPDHGFQDAMHNETAYGIPKGDDGKPDKKGVRTVITRKPLDGGFDSPKDLEKIRDSHIKMILMEETEGLSGSEFKAALVKAGEDMVPPVYRVRIESKLRIIEIADRKTGKIYKGYKGSSNYCYDIWLNDKGKWTGEVVSTFEAYQRAKKDETYLRKKFAATNPPDDQRAQKFEAYKRDQKNAGWWRKLYSPDGRALVMRLRKNDMLEIEHDGRVMIVQIRKFSPGRLFLAEHFEANVDGRDRDKEDDLQYIVKSPSSLQSAKAKRITVSPSGVVKRYI